MLDNSFIAHEVYVLEQEIVEKDLAISTKNPFSALLDPANLPLIIITTIVICVPFALVVMLSQTRFAQKIDKTLMKTSDFGYVFLRIGFGLAIFLAGTHNSIFGPEISFETIGGGMVVQFLFLFLSLAFIAGAMTQLAAIIFITIFVYLFYHVGPYIFTYIDYLGVALVLGFFGSSTFSVDKFLRKNNVFDRKKYHDVGMTIIRISTGIALIYTAYSVKVLHQQLTIDVIEKYHLDKLFHLPSDIIAAGAALSELTVGIFILVGFATRFTAIILAILFTLTLFYFGESLWPHLLLFILGFILIIQSPTRFSVDALLSSHVTNFFKKLKQQAGNLRSQKDLM